jgi:gephyrin
MSRPVAGVRNKTIIITLPGSPKGAKENLQAILKLLPHACQQAAGADSRSLHAGGLKKLESEAGVRSAARSGASSPSEHRHHSHSHGHSHHGHSHGHAMPVRHTAPSETPLSNDPAQGPSRRYRASPYPMLAVSEALALIKTHTPTPTIVSVPVTSSLTNAVLASDVIAHEAVPAYRASIVDGYAVIAPPAGFSSAGTFLVASVSHAAPGAIAPLNAGEISRITTGAPLPPGATAVVMVEDTVLASKTADGTDEATVTILATSVAPGDNIREIGSDIQLGATILRAGEQISAVGGELGLMCSVGVSEIEIFKKPIIGVLSTGDEIVPHDRPGELALGEVRDCNRPAILSIVASWGYEAIDLGIASDTPGSLETALRDALRQCDVVITTGGVSMGELDLLKPTIERSLGGTVHFGRVAMKPGKPTTFSTVPVKSNTGEDVRKVIFSLPGNPVSAVVTLHLFVLPALQRLSGVKEEGLPRVMVTLREGVRLDPRPEYHRVVVAVGGDGELWAESTGGQRSSRVGSLRSANALLCLPAGKGELKSGTRVEALLMGPIKGSE